MEARLNRKLKTAANNPNERKPHKKRNEASRHEKTETHKML